MENEPGFLFDALVLPDGEAAVQRLAADGHTDEFIKDQFRHGKTILALGASQALLDAAKIPPALPSGEPDPGVLRRSADDIDATVAAFIEALSKHRHPARETDPPAV
jgi:catalase